MVQALALDSAPAGELRGWRAHQELIDALPYVDPLTTSEQRAVDQLIEEEMRRSPLKLKDYVIQLPPMPPSRLQADPVLSNEMQRCRAGQPMAKFDQERYNMKEPAMGKRNDIATWQTCIQNAYSQLEHQTNRLVNLELLLKFGPNAWRVFNEGLEAHVNRLQTEAQQLKKDIENVNKQRKVSQLEAGKQLDALQAQWAQGIAKNQEIDRACQELEAQIQVARRNQAEALARAAAEPAAAAAAPPAATSGAASVTASSMPEPAAVEDQQETGGEAAMLDADAAQGLEPAAAVATQNGVTAGADALREGINADSQDGPAVNGPQAMDEDMPGPMPAPSQPG